MELLDLIVGVQDDVSNAKSNANSCAVPEQQQCDASKQDPYKLMQVNSIASEMLNLCGLDILEGSLMLKRAMTAEATFDVHESRLYDGCCSSHDMKEMRTQLSELLQACGAVFMFNASVSEVTTKIYKRIGLWNGAMRENPVGKFLSNYYQSLYQRSVELCPSLQTEQRISSIKNGVSLMTFKALSYIVKEYREMQRKMRDIQCQMRDIQRQSRGHIPF